MTSNGKRVTIAILGVMFLAAMLCSCGKTKANIADGQLASPFASFRDVPGVTQDEIKAIEALKTRYGSFNCAINLNTDSFIDKNGEVSGFAILFYDWISKFFGIPFKPVLYEWNDYLRGIASGEIDFTIDLTDTPERRQIYFMTSPITMRQVKIYRIAGAEPLLNIINSRRPCYAFPVGTNSVQNEVAANAGYDFETIFVNSHAEAYPLLKSGEIDGYIALDTVEAAFDEYGNVVSEDFFPLIFRSSGLLTRNTELLPIILVMEKALNDHTLTYLIGLRNTGHQKYLQNKLYTLLTEEERSYIKNNPIVPVAAEFNNYPVSFFDTYANQWQGIYFDALKGIESLTGLKFKCANEPGAQYPELIARLEKGEALIMSELFRLKEYDGRFLWSEVPLLTDNYAFISRSDFHDIETSEISYLRVGTRKYTTYLELFNKMFPDHKNLTVYDNQEETWEALKNGDFDVVFTSRRRLVIYTNYYEDAGYKLNLIISDSFDTSLGFNKDAAILKSIVDKSLRLIKINNISSKWMNKAYDYRRKLVETQRPLFIGSSIMLVFFLAFVTFFLIKSRRTGKKLEKLVRQRTIELEHETATLKAIFNSSSDYIFCKDLKLRYTRCNKSMEDTFGINEEAILGKTDRDIYKFPMQIIDEFDEQDKKVLDERKHLVFVDQLPWPSDPSQILYVETVKTPLILNGEITGIVGVARDITQRKAIERELEYQTTLLKTIIDSLPDGVFCKDLNLKYTLCNKFMLDSLNKNLDSVLGRDDMEALGLSSDTASVARETDLQILNGQHRVIYQEWIHFPDGTMRLYETAKSPLVLNGNIIGIVAVAHDITEHKAMEEEARSASRAKSAFLANMSHELRTPLNVVIGLTDLVLEEDNLADHIKENLAKISSAGSTLLNIVNDILDFSKIESGKVELTPVEYHMASLLNDVVTLVSTRLGEKPITFTLNISENLPSRLYGDDLRIKQIFNNLLSNAIKYTRNGSIELSVKCRREDCDVWMEVSVKDTGIGITKENLKKLFMDYHQVDTRANRSIEGTGLGLAITKRLTELMGGEISVESEYGKGSVFSVYMRQGYLTDTPIGPTVVENLRKFRYADDKRDVSKKLVRYDLSYARVLVVDDMQTNLDVASGLLRKYKMQVDCLTSGHEAAERIRSGDPVYNAIFMDHMMPGMDGIETATLIRSYNSEYARKIPIIALTANAIQGTENMFYAHGFQAFISKPIDIKELDSVLKKWVRNEPEPMKSSSETSSSPITTAENDDKNLEINIPGVDTKAGLSLYDDDMEIYLPTLRSYVAYTTDVLEKLKNVSEETLPDYIINVHGLKGTSASIGAEIVRESALNLEKLAKAGDLQGVMERNDRFIKGTESIVANIKKWLEKHDGKTQ